MEELIFDKTINKLLEFKKQNLVNELKKLRYLFLLSYIIALFTSIHLFYILLIGFFYMRVLKKIIQNVKTVNDFDFYITIMILGLYAFTISISYCAFIYEIPTFLQISYVYKIFIYTTYLLKFRSNSNQFLNSVILVSQIITTIIVLLFSFIRNNFDIRIVLEQTFSTSLMLYLIYSNLNISHKFNILFEKILKKNDINITKYQNILNNLKTHLISINISEFKIRFNSIFDSLLLKINLSTPIRKEINEVFNDEDNNYSDENGNNINIDGEEMFFNQVEYTTFLDFIGIDLNHKDNLSKKKQLRRKIFYKKLYYVHKILNFFTKKNECNNNDVLFENSDIILKIIKDDFNKFNDQFTNLDNYYINNDSANEECIVNISYRKSKVKNVELIDIILDDITTIVKVEEEKAENKFKRQYLSNVAHEFKAPIQVLLMTIKQIDVKSLPKKEQEKFDDIDYLTNYILLLILDIINFSKEDKGVDIKFRKFEASSPFIFGEKLLKLLIKNNSSKIYSIKTKLDIDKNVPKIIYSDELKVKQILINFISNAFKFTSTGEIAIKVKMINSTEIFDEILVSVEDTGIGIKSEDKDKLFKKFGKLNDYNNLNRQGTGLGLSICLNIVNRIGNTLGFEEKTGGGSIFSFSFYNIKVDDMVLKLEGINSIKIIDVIRLYLKDRYSKSFQEYTIEAVRNPKKHFTHVSNTMIQINGGKDSNTNINNIIPNSNNIIIDTISEEKQKSNKTVYEMNECYNIATEECDYFKFSESNSIFNNDEEIKNDFLNNEILIFDEKFKEANNENKNVNMIYDIYMLSVGLFKNTDYIKILHHFKPYLKFLLSLLKNLAESNTNKNENNEKIYFCIVDDNNVVLNSVKTLINSLNNRNIEVIKAYDGVEALALFKIDFFLNKKIKYIISDQNMTMMTGVELLNLLKKYSSKENKAPKLFLSSSDDANLKEFNLKGISFLSKPISKKEIRNIIEHTS